MFIEQVNITSFVDGESIRGIQYEKWPKSSLFEYYMKKHYEMCSDLRRCPSRYFDLNLMVVENT